MPSGEVTSGHVLRLLSQRRTYESDKQNSAVWREIATYLSKYNYHNFDNYYDQAGNCGSETMCKIRHLSKGKNSHRFTRAKEPIHEMSILIRRGSRAIGFLRNTRPVPSKIKKLPGQHSLLGHHRPASDTPFEWRFAGGSTMSLAFRWRADDGPRHLK